MASLLTLEEYKTIKGKNLANPNEDGRVQALLTSISDMVREYIGRELTAYYATNKVEYSPGNVTFIKLKEYPVVGTALLEYKTSEGTYTAMVDEEDYYIDNDSGIVDAVGESAFSSSRNPKFIRITYRGGYADCPEDIKMAIADYVEKQIKSEHSINKTLGGQDSMSFPSGTQGRLPSHIAVVLDLYREPLL